MQTLSWVDLVGARSERRVDPADVGLHTYPRIIGDTDRCRTRAPRGGRVEVCEFVCTCPLCSEGPFHRIGFHMKFVACWVWGLGTGLCSKPCMNPSSAWPVAVNPRCVYTLEYTSGRDPRFLLARSGREKHLVETSNTGANPMRYGQPLR